MEWADRRAVSHADSVGAGMDKQPGRAMYFEHCMADDARSPFTAPNATEATTPEAEWNFVVGKGGIDRHTWEIIHGAPRQSAEEMPPRIMGQPRVVRDLEETMSSERVRAAGLTVWEVLCFGHCWAVAAPAGNSLPGDAGHRNHSLLRTALRKVQQCPA